MATTTSQSDPCCAPCAPCPPQPKGVDLSELSDKAWLFASGTFHGAMSGASTGGRWGFFAGVALCAVFWAMSALTPGLLVCTLFSAMLTGGTAGVIAGLVGGGIQRVEKGERPKQQRRQGDALNAPFLHEVQDERERQDDFQFERQLQQERENVRDMNNSWKEKMAHVGHEHTPGGNHSRVNASRVQASRVDASTSNVSRSGS